MKKLIKLLSLVLFVGVMFVCTEQADAARETAAPAVEMTIQAATPQAQSAIIDFLISNSVYLLPLLLWVINRFVPTKWRDPLVSLLNFLNKLVPDNKNVGGDHSPLNS